jgi:hypothetical protein
VKGSCYVIISGTVLALVWKDLKKTTNTSVKTIVVLAEILTQVLSDINQKC